MLKYFQNEGMVKLSRGTVAPADKTKLEELSEEQTMSADAAAVADILLR